jgi:hypothetical protein
MLGQAKPPQGLRSGAALECPTGAGGQERSGTPIKLKIRVLIREGWCPNLDSRSKESESGPEPASCYCDLPADGPDTSPG